MAVPAIPPHCHHCAPIPSSASNVVCCGGCGISNKDSINAGSVDAVAAAAAAAVAAAAEAAAAAAAAAAAVRKSYEYTKCCWTNAKSVLASVDGAGSVHWPPATRHGVAIHYIVIRR